MSSFCRDDKSGPAPGGASSAPVVAAAPAPAPAAAPAAAPAPVMPRPPPLPVGNNSSSNNNNNINRGNVAPSNESPAPMLFPPRPPDIGVFVSAEERAADDPSRLAAQAPGAALLRQPGLPPCEATSPAAVMAILECLGGGSALSPADAAVAAATVAAAGVPVFSAATAGALVKAVEAAWAEAGAVHGSSALHPAAATGAEASPAASESILALQRGVVAGSSADDYRLLLSQQAWEALVPDSARAALEAALGCPPAAVVLRRTAPTGRWINFHRDNAGRTVVVPLGAQDDTVGGHLLFLQPDGSVVAPARLCGVPLAHDGDVIHGVTALVAGVRYGLYLLAARAEGHHEEGGA